MRVVMSSTPTDGSYFPTASPEYLSCSDVMMPFGTYGVSGVRVWRHHGGRLGNGRSASVAMNMCHQELIGFQRCVNFATIRSRIGEPSSEQLCTRSEQTSKWDTTLCACRRLRSKRRPSLVQAFAARRSVRGSSAVHNRGLVSTVILP